MELAGDVRDDVVWASGETLTTGLLAIIVEGDDGSESVTGVIRVCDETSCVVAGTDPETADINDVGVGPLATEITRWTQV